MITDFKCNKVWFSDLLAKRHPTIHEKLVDTLNRNDIEHKGISGTKDIWCRDYMPVQVDEDKFIRFTYNPDYLTGKRYVHLITDNQAVCENVSLSNWNRHYSFIRPPRPINLDGGNVIRCDDKVIMIDKVFEENPQYTVCQLSTMLEKVFNAEIVFLPWDPDEIYGHADGLVRYVGNNNVMLSNYARYNAGYVRRVKKILAEHFDDIHELYFKPKSNNPFNWAYINWLQTDKVIIIPKFDCDEDYDAFEQIRKAMPRHQRIVMVEATDLAKEGGCFNCISWTTAEPNCVF